MTFLVLTFGKFCQLLLSRHLKFVRILKPTKYQENFNWKTKNQVGFGFLSDNQNFGFRLTSLVGTYWVWFLCSLKWDLGWGGFSFRWCLEIIGVISLILNRVKTQTANCNCNICSSSSQRPGCKRWQVKILSRPVMFCSFAHGHGTSRSWSTHSQGPCEWVDHDLEDLWVKL